jgi:AhpC/TSA family protein
VAFVPHGRSLVKKYQDRPFVLLGVDCYDELEVVKAFVKEKEANWRHFFDGKEAPIAAAWGVQGFPTMHLIDHEGKIAVANVAKGDLDAKIAALVAAAEAARKPKPEGDGAGDQKTEKSGALRR